MCELFSSPNRQATLILVARPKPAWLPVSTSKFLQEGFCPESFRCEYKPAHIQLSPPAITMVLRVSYAPNVLKG
jgi:hypothetical protein